MREITIKAEKLTSFIEKSKGLMGKDKSKTIYFTTRFGIHTFFLKFPIDVIILDEKRKVVKVKKNLKPNRVYFWNPIFKRVLETPAGFVEKEKIEPGCKFLNI
jgi:uncharacterized membrane protein (UPF0127 family)